MKKITLFGFAFATITLFGTYFSNQKEAIPKTKEEPGFYKQWFEWKKNENGIIPANRFANWSKQDLTLAQNNSRRSGLSPILEVVELGPTSVAGRTRALMVHPDNNNVIFAAGISGGLWKTTNQGASWNPLNDHQASLMVSCITINPFNHNELYYGTGEMRANSASVSGDGIFKSTDGGNTFSQLSGASNSALNQIWTIKHSLADSNTIFVGTNTAGLYYSNNKGDTWQKYTNSTGAIADLEVFENGNILCGVTGNGIYMAKEGTSTFTKMTLPSPGSFSRIEIEKCKNFPNVVYAALEGSGSSHKVYKSSDGGLTWSYLSLTSPGTAYSRYCFDMAVHPNDSDKLVVTALALNWSYDGGKTWISGSYGHADHHSHAYLTSNNGDDVLLGSDGGVTIHSFADRTKIKRINEGYKVTQFYAGNYGPSGDTWIAGTQDNGTHRNINGAHKKVNGGDGGYAHISLQNSNLAYFSTQRGYTYRTNNFNQGSTNKVLISNSDMTDEGVSFINLYYMNKADGTQLYYRTNKGIWRTTDSGTSWKKISNVTSLYSITSSEEKDPVLYFGKNSSQLYRMENAATNNSMTETTLSANRPSQAGGGNILGIKVHPENKNTVYLAYGNNSSNPRIWKVERCDEPDSLVWTNVSGNLPTGLPVNDIALHPQAPDSILFAATDFGLYFSTDFGNTWEKEMQVPSVAIFKIKMRSSDNHAFLFTHGRGNWRISCSDLSPSTSIKEHDLLDFTVYPNPVKTGLLKLNIPNNQINTTIKILDLSGKVVLRESNQSRLDVSNLASGLYFIEVSHKSQKAVQKIVIEN